MTRLCRVSVDRFCDLEDLNGDLDVQGLHSLHIHHYIEILLSQDGETS